MSCELPPGLNGNWLRKNYLFGIVLTDDAGRPYPEEMYTRQIAAAVRRLETKLGIAISPKVVVNDLYDVQLTSSPRFQFRLKTRPVRSITRWAFRSWNGTLRDVDLSRVTIRSQIGGEVELDLRGPITGIWDGSRWLPGMVQYYKGSIQAAVAISYQAGFDGSTFELSADMADWIGMTAALLPLDTAGDLIAGAGIANKSVSQDGLSQSLGTTASATNAGYGARILSYAKRLPQTEEDLKAAYRAPRFMGL